MIALAFQAQEWALLAAVLPLCSPPVPGDKGQRLVVRARNLQARLRLLKRSEATLVI